MNLAIAWRQNLTEWLGRVRRWFGVRGFLFGLLLMGAGGAYAHKVNVFAYVEGDQVYVQGYFIDGKKARNSTVVVYGDGDVRLAEGETNEEGEFTFPIAGDQGIRVVLNAGQGHQAEYRLSAVDLSGGETHDAVTVAPGDQADGVAPDASPSGAAGGNVELVVRRAVAEGMLPLARELAELKERRSLSDIIGGVGLIAGILGVFAYFKSKKSA